MKLTATKMQTLTCECGSTVVMDTTVSDSYPGLYLHRCSSCPATVLLSGQQFPSLTQWVIDSDAQP